MGDRDSGVGWCGDARGDTGDDLEWDAGRRQCLSLFAAAAEHERVAAFEANDAFSLPREVYEERVDISLGRRGVVATALADATGVLGGGVESWAHERVVDHDIARRQKLLASDGDQPRIAWSRANEIDHYRRNRRARHQMLTAYAP